MRWKKWLSGFAALPLVCLPLIAQETKPPESRTQTQTPAQAQTPAAVKQPTESTSAQDTPEPVSQEQPEPADEHISADNNLSFPVDI